MLLRDPFTKSQSQDARRLSAGVSRWWPTALFLDFPLPLAHTACKIGPQVVRTIVASFAAVVAPVWHHHGVPNKTLNWSRIRAAGSLRSAVPTPGPVSLDVRARVK